MAKDKNPSWQFYPGDWMKDPSLRACSLQARGLWIDLLCLMFESPRRGYLQMDSGKPMTAEHVARSTGCSPDEASRLLQELTDSGVASHSDTEGYYSRRMIRDEQRRGEWREKKRGQRGMSRDCPPDVPRLSRDCPSLSSSSSSSSDLSPPTREAERATTPTPPLQTAQSDGPDFGVPAWWVHAHEALNRWSTVSRKHHLIAARNETQTALAKLEVLAAGDAVVFGGEQVNPHALFPRVIDVLMKKGTVFKNVDFACGCIRNEIDDWRQNGSPGANGKSTRRTSADERRAAKAAGEYAQPIDIPTS